MPFDMSPIPITNRSPAAIAQHLEMYKKSQDLWEVYNPTDQDYTIWYDKKMPGKEHWVVPNKNKDIGYGKGLQHVPTYAMDLYREHMGIEILNKQIKEDWDKKKLEFRLEDRSKMEYSLALRTSDPTLWEPIVKLLIKRLVKKFNTDDDLQEIEDIPDARQARTPAEEIMNKLGTEYFEAEPSAKDAFLDQIS